ncbi:uncharacterized protein LOC126204339 [Schistocerca nitens]|uniref:uncharacterized protein LOC126204339 n=1 Tax=Schistocerca nitens TaxID=7011 RepID=UPI002118F391|nr:uncharacterized protein LOC126204339 [Schistocerca nitens]
MPPRCVRCAGNHASRECRMTPQDKPKCANCSGAHTASYQGCPAHKRAKARQTGQITNNKNTYQAPTRNNTNKTTSTTQKTQTEETKTKPRNKEKEDNTNTQTSNPSTWSQDDTRTYARAVSPAQTPTTENTNPAATTTQTSNTPIHHFSQALTEVIKLMDKLMHTMTRKFDQLSADISSAVRTSQTTATTSDTPPQHG